jgi:hypothetical protein
MDKFEFDNCGNLYFKNQTLNIKQINIDKNNLLIFEDGNYSLIEDNKDNEETKINLLKFYENSLKKEVAESIKLLDDEDPEIHNEYYKEDDYYNQYIEYDYNPDGFFGDEYYETLENKCYFSSNQINEIKINKRKNGDIEPIYETLIFEKNNLVFRTSFIEEPPFRLILNLDNDTIELKSVGNRSKLFKIENNKINKLD